jgi:hypothetical protein
MERFWLHVTLAFLVSPFSLSSVQSWRIYQNVVFDIGKPPPSGSSLWLIHSSTLSTWQWCLRESAKVPVTKIDFRLPSFVHSICLNISVLENQWTHSLLAQWYKKCWRKRNACNFRFGFYPYRHTATLYIRMEILAQSVPGEFYQMYAITYKTLYHRPTNITNASYNEMQLKTCSENSFQKCRCLNCRFAVFEAFFSACYGYCLQGTWLP